jgi:UDP-N-acetylmuramoyl-tripeptide--D-alanyl-D-alanine ligase
MHLNREFIKSVIPAATFHGTDIPLNASFSVDSRTIKKGEIFVALSGANSDGHNFIVDAINKGASGLMICKSKESEYLKKIGPNSLIPLSVIVVPDPLKALLAIASSWRKQFTYPVVGITGSVGKTSTKEIIGHIMNLANKKYIISEKNQNTAIGLALNILKMRPEHEVAIFELGINKQGEMAEMANMLRPTTALITNIGHCHMEGLGSLNEIAAEKRSIFKYFKEDNIGIISGDQPILSSVSYNHPVLRFGQKTINQIQGRKIRIQPTHTNFILKIYRNRYEIKIPTNHIAPVLNSLAATSVATLLGVPDNIIIKGLETLPTIQSRFELKAIKNKKAFIIDDCYNANPESMKAALLAFEKLESKGAKIAVLGDMLELGMNSPFWHRQLGRFLRKVPSLKHVVFVGENVKWVQKTVPISLTYEIVPTWQQAVDKLSGHIKEGSCVLVKGSLSMGLKNLVKTISE